MPSEILALDWRRVDRQAAVIRLDVNETKNDDGREFHYGALTDVCAMIEAQWAAHETLRKAGTISPFVFQRFGGKRIVSFRKAWIAACAAAGVPGRDPARLPADGGPQPGRAGVSRSVAMKVTGHKTGERLPSICYRQQWRPRRSGRKAARARDRDKNRDNRSIGGIERLSQSQRLEHLTGP